MAGDDIPFVQHADHLLTVLIEQIAMAEGNVILLVTPVHLCELDGLTHLNESYIDTLRYI